MTWVICQSSTTNENLAVNSNLVKEAVIRNGKCLVLNYIDGTHRVVNMTQQEWLAATAPLQTVNK